MGLMELMADWPATGPLSHLITVNLKIIFIVPKFQTCEHGYPKQILWFDSSNKVIFVICSIECRVFAFKQAVNLQK